MAAQQPMEPPPVNLLRISPRSAVVLVAMLGATFALIRLVTASQRVLGWILVAGAIAGLLHPLVGLFARRLPHGIAVLVVVLMTAAIGGLIAYGVAGSVVRETHTLQRALPRRAAELEHSKRFGEAARQFHLADRTRSFVKEVPARLRGGTTADALRSAATRGVAFLATFVLTIFFLLHGPRLANGAIDQVTDERRRQRVREVATRAYRRGFGYARGSMATGILAGTVAYAIARLAGVPGAAPLGVWVALWDLVPIVGAFIGAVPIIGLAAVHSAAHAAAVTLAFVVYQVVEQLALQRDLERRTIKLGPFLTLAGGFAGIELYGIGGALMVLLAGSVAVAAADELAPGT